MTGVGFLYASALPILTASLLGLQKLKEQAAKEIPAQFCFTIGASSLDGEKNDGATW